MLGGPGSEGPRTRTSAVSQSSGCSDGRRAPAHTLPVCLTSNTTLVPTSNTSCYDERMCARPHRAPSAEHACAAGSGGPAGVRRGGGGGRPRTRMFWAGLALLRRSCADSVGLLPAIKGLPSLPHPHPQRGALLRRRRLKERTFSV